MSPDPGPWGWIKLLFVAEGDRFKRQDRFAGFVHWLDVVFVASRGKVDLTKFSATDCVGEGDAQLVGANLLNYCRRVTWNQGCRGATNASAFFIAPKDHSFSRVYSPCPKGRLDLFHRCR
jgi:hypothetical protein